MFSENFGLMLYVNDVITEKAFWSAIGFEIVSSSQLMGYETFEMKPEAKSTVTITVYDKAFIAQASPEVADNVPSLLFETDDIEKLHRRISSVTDKISPIGHVPFSHFNFASPSGIYMAVRQV